MLRLMAAPAAAGQTVHIGNDREEINIGDLAKLVLRVVGVNPAIAAEPAPPGSVTRRCPDLSRLRELDLYSLDYADSPGLADFAERRARQFGLQSFVSDRALSRA